jgi:hypothetical protein
MAKKKPNQKMRIWIDARNRHRLSHTQVQMARELGMNPAKLGKLDNDNQEPWKMPLGHYVEHLYRKRFDRERPENVLSLEEKIRLDEENKRRKREAKLRNRQQHGADEGGSRPNSDRLFNRDDPSATGETAPETRDAHAGVPGAARSPAGPRP